MRKRLLGILILSLLALGLNGIGHASLTDQTAELIGFSLPSGLVSWWDGDTVSGTTAFDIQDGNNGTLMNGATTAPGKVGNAFSLGGVNDYIEIADNTNLKPTNAITVNAWVKFNSFPDGVSVHIVDRNSSESGKPNEGYILATYGTGPPTFQIWTNTSSPIQNTATGTTNIADNNFHHIAGTYDGSVVKVYVDGVLEKSTAASGSIVYAGTLNLWLGANQQPSQYKRSFKGLIDEVQIYNRALSDSEIKALYDGQNPSCYDDGYAAGQAACKANPASCGINVNPGTAVTLTPDLKMHLPNIQYNTIFGVMSIWADLAYDPTKTDGVYFKVTGAGEN